MSTNFVERWKQKEGTVLEAMVWGLFSGWWYVFDPL
jgi:hypothetical protein